MSDSDEPVVAGSERGELTERPRLVASLAAEQRVRLEEPLLTYRAAAADTRILPRAADESCPLSLTQQRL